MPRLQLQLPELQPRIVVHLGQLRPVAEAIGLTDDALDDNLLGSWRRRASRVRERGGGEWLGDVRFGDFPFSECGGILSSPDIPTLLDGGGDKPRPLGEAMVSLVPFSQL